MLSKTSSADYLAGSLANFNFLCQFLQVSLTADPNVITLDRGYSKISIFHKKTFLTRAHT